MQRLAHTPSRPDSDEALNLRVAAALALLQEARRAAEAAQRAA